MFQCSVNSQRNAKVTEHTAISHNTHMQQDKSTHSKGISNPGMVYPYMCVSLCVCVCGYWLIFLYDLLFSLFSSNSFYFALYDIYRVDTYLIPLIELVDHFQCNLLHFRLRIAICRRLRASHLLSLNYHVLLSKIDYPSAENFVRWYEPATHNKFCAFFVSTPYCYGWCWCCCWRTFIEFQ